MSVPIHVSREPRPGDRGRAFGRANAGAVAHAAGRYRVLFRAVAGLGDEEVRALALAAGEAVAARHPELVEEMAGVAAGAGVDEAAVLALNARTEILAGAGPPECSAVAMTAPGACLMAQNWDWHPDLAPARVVWLVEDPELGWWCTLTEAGILAKIGMSGRGVGVLLNLLLTTADGGPGGMPVHLLIRLVLAHAAGVDAAREILGGHPVTASSTVTVGTPGAATAFELTPGGLAAVGPGARGLLAHTNHCLVEPQAGTDRVPREYPGSVLRLPEVRAALASAPATLAAVRAALASHANAPLSVCAHEVPGLPLRERRATLASVAMDLAARRMWVADGAPCVAPFEEIPLPA